MWGWSPTCNSSPPSSPQRGFTPFDISLVKRREGTRRICCNARDSRHRIAGEYRTGFTLVELVMVATLVSIIALAMASSFLSGMRVWGRAQHRDAAHADALLTLERMARELRQSVDIPQVRFEGTAQEVSFPAVLGAAIVKVTYRYEASEKRLQRRQVDLKELIEGKEAGAHADTLFSPADQVLMEFAGDVWKDAWSKEDGIPWAIRLTITIKDETVTKTVVLPIA